MKVLAIVAFVVFLPLSAQAATKVEIAVQVMFAPQCTIGWLLNQIKIAPGDPNNQKNCWWNKKK